MIYKVEENTGSIWKLVDNYQDDDSDHYIGQMEYEDEQYALWCEIEKDFGAHKYPERSNLLMTSTSGTSCFKPHRNPLTENHGDIKAEFLADSKGNNLLYPGVITLLYGKPGTYKSWIALSLIGQRKVRYWDFENFGPTIATRLRLLEVNPEDACIFDYPESRANILNRIPEYIQDQIDILVIDGFSGIARTMGINTDANDQVERLYEEVFIPLKKAGISILVLDHLPKDSPVDDFPIGAQAKKSQCDVAILLRGRRDSDEVDVFITKDRNDELFSRCASGPTPKLYGWLTKPSKANKFRATIEPDLVAVVGGIEIDSFSANLYREIWEFVQNSPDSSGTKIEESVSGKNARIRAALKWLLLNDFLTQSKKGNATYYQVAKSLDAAMSWRSRGDYIDL
jgi:hypothetical protein